jgi:NDP-sugar pyrophosphorylase family protein
MNIVLPAAGLGSRFKNAGINTPKPLIPVLGVPMLIWVLWNFSPKEEDKVWIIGQKQHELENFLSPYFRRFVCEIELINVDGLTDGPAGTLEIGLRRISDSEPIICANTDQYVFADLSGFLRDAKGPSSGSILTMNASGTAWSYVKRDESGGIAEVAEKVEISNEATVGIYGWSNAELAKSSIKKMRDSEDRVNNEFYVAPSYNYLIEGGFPVSGVNLGDYGDTVQGIGTPIDYAKFIKCERAKLIAKQMREHFN